MRTFQRSLKSAALCAAITALLPLAAPAAAPDLSSPKAAALSLGKAMIADDAATAAAAASITDEQKPMFEQVVHLAAAMHRMQQAAVKKWGEEGKQVTQAAQRPGQKGQKGMTVTSNYQDPEERIKEIENADVKINGDTATLTPKSENAKPITCKKVGGDWKVDMFAMAGGAMQQNPAMVPLIQGMVKAADDTASEIKADKFKTVDEARSAHQSKIREAIMQQYQNNPGAFQQQRGQKGQKGQKGSEQ